MLQNLKVLILRIINYMTSRTKIQNKPTILVNKSSWDAFNSSDYSTDKFDIVCVNPFTIIPRKNYRNIIAYIGHIEKKQLKKFNNLQWLQIASHGYNGFDSLSLYKNPSITVTNLTSIFSKPIADFCYAAYHAFNCYALRRLLNPTVSIKSTSLTPQNPIVTIIGLGNIGIEIAKLFKFHNWIVYGVKRTIPKSIPQCVDSVSTLSECESYLKTSDYIINVLPETNNTIKLYNAHFFKKMKPTAVFCNVGRGSAVIDSDLEYAVKNHIIRGAVLDASNSYQYKTSNVICTHHRSSFSVQNSSQIDAFFSSQLNNFIDNGISGLSNIIKLNN